jgi:hypothetical protein
MKKQNIKPEEDSNYKIRDLKITELVPNNVDYLVSIVDGHHLVVFPTAITGQQFQTWKKSRGGIFSKDVLNYTLKKEHGNYILVKGEDKYFIARLISDDELLKFEALNLIDGKIKDKPYMILKHLEEEDNLTSTRINVFEKTEEEMEFAYSSPNPEPTIDDEADYHGNSISLFKDE